MVAVAPANLLPTGQLGPQAAALLGGPPPGLGVKKPSPGGERLCDALESLVGGGRVASLIQELVAVAGQQACAEAMLAQAVAGAPAIGTEAEKWHRVAAQAAEWSCTALGERQKACLQQLREAISLTEAIKAPRAPPGLPAPGGAAGQRADSPEAEESSGTPPESPKARRTDEPEGSMKRGLEALREHNPDCILIVRKIKKLGFGSPTLLREHFSKFGEVSDIHVANSMMKPSAKRPAGRMRPAALGFVVMADSEAAAAALAAGLDQPVGPTEIEVKKFEPFTTDKGMGDELDQ